MGANWIRPWDGGRVREVDGASVWVIERMRQNRRYVVALDVHSENDALAELALFERNPAGYRTRKETAACDPGAAVLDAESLAEFAKSTAHLSKVHRWALGKYLSEWGVALKHRDLRRVTLSELLAMLDVWPTARHHRIVALKTFTAWLRERDKLRRAEDPTLDLRVPVAIAEKTTRAKGYTAAHVERFYAESQSQLLRDLICLRAKTGMHGSEISRLAAGEAVLRRIDDPSGIVGTLTFRHLKKGADHVVSVDGQAFAAAERLAGRGKAYDERSARRAIDRARRRIHGCGGVAHGSDDHGAVRLACPECPVLHLSELRHSFATWAEQSGELVKPKDRGVARAEVAAVLGHKSTHTTGTFYTGNVIPPMIRVPLNLRHTGDPKAARAKRISSAR